MKLTRYKSIFREGRFGDSPILPLGGVNLQTGKSKYFNIYETWDNSTAEVWKKDDGKYILIFTAGNKPLAKVGERDHFIHDQTRRGLFTATMVDYATIDQMKNKLKKYGNIILGYTYK